MNVGILGAGAMAEAIGQRLVANGHALFVSYSRDPNKLDRLAITLGHGTRAGEPYDAARFGDVLLLATGWQGPTPRSRLRTRHPVQSCGAS
jgi:8-hydroxy-5-deazaflavin:NADPH oxidoreductase